MDEAQDSHSKPYCDIKTLELLRKKAKAEIGEEEETIPQRIADLKLLISKDADIVLHPPIYDEFYLRCLRARKYNLQRAAKLYKKCCSVRHGSGSAFATCLIPSKQIGLFNAKFSAILGSRDLLGRQILIGRAERWDVNEHSVEDCLASMFLLIDEALESIDTQLNGIIIIGDLKGLTLSHARAISPSILQLLASYLQEAYPARYKQIHFFNNPFIFSLLFSIIKPLISEKIKKRIYFHGSNASSLHKALSVGPDYLPTFLGGKLSEDEFADEELTQRVLAKDGYYRDFLKYGCPSKN